MFLMYQANHFVSHAKPYTDFDPGPRLPEKALPSTYLASIGVVTFCLYGTHKMANGW